MRIGLGLTPIAAAGADPIAEAMAAEALGFDYVSISDHLHGEVARYETWTAMAWVAASTTRVHVAARVLAVPYRAPAVLAKMAETFQRLSGGRLILGLGAGAMEEEFRAFGLVQRPLGARMTGLEEAIRICRGLWSETSFTFEGSEYRTDDARLEPKPEHHIPIWLGTRGPRGLALTGRLADGWIPSFDMAPPDESPGMLRIIDQAARDAGRDPSEIERVLNVVVSIGASDDPLVSIHGEVDAIAGKLIGILERGFTGLNLIVLPGPDREEQVERLAREVLPAVRAAR